MQSVVCMHRYVRSHRYRPAIPADRPVRRPAGDPDLVRRSVT